MIKSMKRGEYKSLWVINGMMLVVYRDRSCGEYSYWLVNRHLPLAHSEHLVFIADVSL